MTIYCHTPYTFFRVFTPEIDPDAREDYGSAAVEFPEGDISFMNAITPIGTMFKKAEVLGPQSQPETEYDWDSEPVMISLTFDFKTR